MGRESLSKEAMRAEFGESAYYAVYQRLLECDLETALKEGVKDSVKQWLADNGAFVEDMVEKALRRALKGMIKID